MTRLMKTFKLFLIIYMVVYPSGPVRAANRNFVLEEATISGIHAAMKSGQLTSRQLTEMYLKRIASYDKKGPALNAIIFLNPHALELADELDAKFKKSGFVGPLHGIPIIIKDNLDTKDMPTTAGSLSLEGFIPPDDAFIVKKLRQAGAIIVGKGNLHEFAFGSETISSLGGQTLNPYDLTRTPGGSSGGPAAAIAANFGAVAIGTDTGNSIRSPASSNNLIGIRPTLGLISRAGIVPNSSGQDTAGPLTRTVSDAALLMDILVGYDPEDSITAWGVGNTPKSYQSFLDRKGLQKARLGVLKCFFGKGEEPDQVNAVMGKAIEAMKKQGAVIIPLEEQIDSKTIADTNMSRYETQDELNQYLQKMGVLAPVKSLEEIIASGKYHKRIEEGIKNRHELSKNDLEYKERLIRRIKLQNNFMKMMADHQLDAIIYPHQTYLVSKVGKGGMGSNGLYIALLGFPSIAVPVGFSRPTQEAPLGVPIGMEIVGRPWTDSLLIKLAYAFEQATKWRRPPSSTPPLDR